MNFKKEKGSDNIPEFELPQLQDNLERKLQILENEWFVQTSYSQDDSAALYQFFKPTQGPFVIIPSMTKDSTVAEFNLTGKCLFETATLTFEFSVFEQPGSNAAPERGLQLGAFR